MTDLATRQLSGLSWTDTLPSHWQVGNIRRFATMKSGHTPSRAVPEYWESVTVPWFTLADVWQLREGTRMFLGVTTSKISELGLANSAAEVLPAGTVVLSRTASVGFTGVMPCPMATSQDFWNWVCGPQLMPEFLVYLFRAMREEFNALMTGSTHKTIYQPVAAAIRIPVPPVAEQQQIVEFLSNETAQIDALIAKQEQLIARLCERRSTALALAFADLPHGATQLRYVAEIQTGVTLSGSGDAEQPEWPYLRVANVQAGYLDLSRITTLRLAPAVAQASMLRPGDVLMTEGGDIDKLGRGAVWHGEIEPMLHQNHIFAVRPRMLLDSEFLVLWLDAPVARTHFYTTARKTTNLASTNKTIVGRLPVTLPPIEMQREFVASVAADAAKIDALIAKAEEFIALALERRAALITEAVTGRIGVSMGKSREGA